MNKKQIQSAFTLIELLLVIAIIGLLSSIILAGLSVSRKQARDAARILTVEAIEKALEMYASDHGGAYPQNPLARPYYSFKVGFFDSYYETLDTALAPYLKVPKTGGTTDFAYSYYSNSYVFGCNEAFLGSSGAVRFLGPNGYYISVVMEGSNQAAMNDKGINNSGANPSFERFGGKYEIHHYSAGPFVSWC